MNSIEDLTHTLRAYKSSHMLATAVGLGILDALAQQKATINDISAQCELSQDYSRLFLRVLRYFGLIKCINSQYQLTSLGDEAVRDEIFSSFSSYHMYGFEAWSALRKCCRVGANGGGYHQSKMSDPQFCQAYLLALESIAKNSLSFLRERCEPLLGGRIIDIGAGPSTLRRQLAQAGDCHVTGLDLPPMVEIASKIFSYPENFTWVATDFHELNNHETYDGVFCSHFLEYSSEENLSLWLQKIGTLIRAGGASAFVVFLRTDEADISIDLDMFEISTGLNGETLGHICTVNEMESALSELDCYDIVCSPVPRGATYSEFLVTCHWK